MIYIYLSAVISYPFFFIFMLWSRSNVKQIHRWKIYHILCKKRKGKVFTVKDHSVGWIRWSILYLSRVEAYYSYRNYFLVQSRLTITADNVLVRGESTIFLVSVGLPLIVNPGCTHCTTDSYGGSVRITSVKNQQEFQNFFITNLLVFCPRLKISFILWKVL